MDVDETTNTVTLDSGFTFDAAAADAHDIDPGDVVIDVQSWQDAPPELFDELSTPLPDADDTRTVFEFDASKFIGMVGDALKGAVGYAWALTQEATSGGPPRVFHYAKTPADNVQEWTPDTGMHIASVSKLITAISMTRALHDNQLTADTKIVDYLPDYWVKGANIDLISFGNLLTHTSGFPKDSTCSNYQYFKKIVASGVQDPSKIGHELAYSNANFGICRILLPILNGTIPADTDYTKIGKDQDTYWDYSATNAYTEYTWSHVLAPSGITNRARWENWFDHADTDALAYQFPPQPQQHGWNSGNLVACSGGAGWHLSVNDLRKIMSTFRRSGSILSPDAAQDMLAAKFGIDWAINLPGNKSAYWKNGLWRKNNQFTEQCLVGFLPLSCEVIVFINSNFDTNDNVGALASKITEIYRSCVASTGHTA